MVLVTQGLKKILNMVYYFNANVFCVKNVSSNSSI